MLFSYNWLQQFFKERLPKPDRLAELLTMHAFEVEGVRKVKNDWVFDIAVLPNRADCLSHVGIAREIAAITPMRLTPLKMQAIKLQKETLTPLKISIENARLVPRYAAFLIENVRIGKSPDWMKKRLGALGVNSINNVVDVTNYVMLELGQPLHAFDYDTIKDHEMEIRVSKEEEKIETLDDQILALPQGVLVIEDSEGLIDLAGMKGGKASAISSATKNIVLQAANFEAQAIYKAKKQLGYTSQAADIYSHGIDPNLAKEALQRALALFEELGVQGRVVQFIDIYPRKIFAKRIVFDVKEAESLLGVSISLKEIRSMFAALGCTIRDFSNTRNTMEVEIATRRMDLETSQDLIEEIGRIYGYEKIPDTLPTAALTLPERNAELFWREMLQDTLKEAGMTEVYNYSFMGEHDLLGFQYSEKEKKKLVELANPVSEEFKYLRDSLVENLLKNVQTNARRFEEMRMFEIGKVFQRSFKEIYENYMVGGVIVGGERREKDANREFYELKGIIDFLFERLGIGDVWYDEYLPTPEESRNVLWHKGKTAEIKSGDEEIGFLGEISPSILSGLKIFRRVAAFHIDLAKLVGLALEGKEYESPLKFPPVRRDIALLVPTHTRIAEVLNVVEIAGGSLVKDTDLFDMYEGEGIPEGKKNLAFHIVYQAEDRTLTLKEVDALHDKIIQAIEENVEWEVRT